ncbi:pyruvate dehydrogenase (acetyl-transferring) E1 component subunit alpha [Microbacterium soli]|uniref:2-oxoisovalerate dehydrogenase subunit alpha n=1 Tax=Microbacterium soli TaxID=446075 RepID=A0ABP7ND69_9MICO
MSEDGERIPHPELDTMITDLTIDDLRGLYRDMAVVRRIDTEATALQRQGELGLWAPLLGQEAAQVGSARALRTDDFVFSSYREHAVAHLRGAKPVELLRMCRGTAHSGWDPLEIRMAPMQIIIGAQTLHAVGYGMGIRNQESDDVAVTYFGDGATSQGSVSEAMVFAASFNLPVLFFCQNNQYAISEPVGLQSRAPLAQRALGFGIPAIRIDGNDVLAALAATRFALAHIREHGAPVFIEAITYRMGPHTTSDDPSRYRPEQELEDWRTRDPLLRLERLLAAADESTGLRDLADSESDEIARVLREECLALSDPDPEEIFAHVYSTEHRVIDRQRSFLSAYLGMFEEEGS